MSEERRLIGREEFNNYKKFAFKGNMVQMAVAFMLGAAFSKVVSSISECLIMPVANFFVNKTGEDWRQFTWEPLEGMALEVGKFSGAFLDFFIISLILFIIYRKVLVPLMGDE